MHGSAGVSVVIPTHNRPQLTIEAVRSALAQAWAPLEVVVVDDASTDDTRERVAGIAADDARVRVIALDHNAGPSVARNRGVAEARHPFVAFLDSDNVWLPEKLSRQMPALLAAAPGAVSFTGYTLQEAGRSALVALDRWSAAPDDVIERLMYGCCVNTSTLVAPRELLLAEPFRADLHCCEDHELWLRLAAAQHHFVYCAEPLAAYRPQAGSLSADRLRVAETSERVIGDFLAGGELPAGLRPSGDRFRARWALNSAGAYLADGQGRASLSALARAARFAPLAIRPGWLLIAVRALASALSGR